MLELARRRLGPEADLRVADLGSPLPYPDGAFDDVIACAVLNYLRDWTAPLAELRRVLKPGGRLIVAVDHPFAIAIVEREADRKRDYVATWNRTEESEGRRTSRGESRLGESNPRPTHYECVALPSELRRRAVLADCAPQVYRFGRVRCGVATAVRSQRRQDVRTWNSRPAAQ